MRFEIILIFIIAIKLSKCHAGEICTFGAKGDNCQRHNIDKSLIKLIIELSNIILKITC